MLIYGVNLDVSTNQPVIILKDKEGKQFLPIWVGQFEATSILMELQGIKPTRPLTHDLLKSVLDEFEVKTTRVVITELKEGTFYARIHLIKDSVPFEIDARPSDAIALSVRAKARIYVDEEVMDQAAILSKGGAEEEIERFKEFLDSIEPADFNP
ncbi:MAG: bifunctional nuclease family protein [Candidatus Subteraquimicrobiales bacterium]|nr:bifunctional nuclease family protein [Candidatus Subteraquimicrobiales bacterium]